MTDCLKVLAVATLVLLAGCQGWPTGPSQSTESLSRTPSGTGLPTEDGGSQATNRTVIEVRGGSLPVDPLLVWQRTQKLLGSNVSPPETIVVSQSRRQPYRRPFYRSFTGCDAPADSPLVGGSVRLPDAVYLYGTSSASAATIEKILVHEYAHVVQFRTNAMQNLTPSTRGPVLQGGAIYTADVYTQTYLGTSNTTLPSREAIDRFRAAPPCKRVFSAQNYFGHRYVDHRVDSPRELRSLYADPPRTSEQLLHNSSPRTVSSRPLPVEFGQDARHRLLSSRTMGELAVRSMLWTRLSRSRAQTAATGWGNDRLLQFWNGTGEGYVWILRWDDTANATEFAGALDTYFDRRATRTDGGWIHGEKRFEMSYWGEDTVIVTVGDAEFVRWVNLTEANGTVSVSV